MSKSVFNKWDSFDEALSMFELDFKIERNQGIQECREPLDAFLALDASFVTDESINAAVDVKKPL